MKKRIFSSLLCCICLFIFVACGSAEGIATVNGENVEEEYFKYYFTELKNIMQNQHGEDAWQDASLDGKPALEYVRECALQKAVDDKVVMMKALENKIALTDEDEKSIADIKQQWIEQYGSKEDLLKFFEDNYGWDEENFDYMLKVVFYSDHIMNKYVTVTDEEVLKYYNDNISKVKHILIATVDLNTGISLSDEDLEKAKNKVNDIQRKIDNGVDFDSLVSEYTQDQDVFYYVGEGYTLNENGTQGSSMVPEFEAVSLALGNGEISGVVESTYGYHIIKRYENDTEMYEKANDVLSYSLKTELFANVVNEWKENMDIVINEEMYNSYE